MRTFDFFTWLPSPKNAQKKTPLPGSGVQGDVLAVGSGLLSFRSPIKDRWGDKTVTGSVHTLTKCD
jgi:hypothetical protein